MTFDHFVVTRVNLQRPDVSDANRDGISTKLLNAMARASLRSQTSQAFTWLTLWRDKNVVGPLLPNEHPLAMPPSPDQFHTVAPHLIDAIHGLSTKDVVVITRLDSDDALCRVGIEHIGLHFASLDGSVLPCYADIGSLCQLVPGNPKIHDIGMPYDHVKTSPFVSVAFRRDNMGGLDNVMRKHVRAYSVSGGIGCRLARVQGLQLIHGKNIRNRLRGKADTPTKLVLSDFFAPGTKHVY